MKKGVKHVSDRDFRMADRELACNPSDTASNWGNARAKIRAYPDADQETIIQEIRPYV